MLNLKNKNLLKQTQKIAVTTLLGLGIVSQNLFFHQAVYAADETTTSQANPTLVTETVEASETRENAASSKTDETASASVEGEVTDHTTEEALSETTKPTVEETTVTEALETEVKAEPKVSETPFAMVGEERTASETEVNAEPKVSETSVPTAGEERTASETEVAATIPIHQFNDLDQYPGKENTKDKILIYFDGQSGYLKLKWNKREMANLFNFKFPYKATNKKQQLDLNDHKGKYLGLKWEAKKDHMLLYTNDPGKADEGVQALPAGQYSGKAQFVFRYNKKKPVETPYSIYMYYLKFDNNNQPIHQYIDEQIPEKTALLNGIQLNIHAKDDQEKNEQETMLNQLMANNKKIIAYETTEADGQVKRVELKDDFTINDLPKNQEFDLIVQLTNPTKVLTKEGKQQTMEYKVHTHFVDTKTPLVQSITEEAEAAKKKIEDNQDLTAEQKKALKDDIEAKKAAAIEAINKAEVKHDSLDNQPFKGNEEDKKQALEAALAKRNEIKAPVDLANQKNLIIADFMANTKKAKEKIAKNNDISDDEKQKLQAMLDDALEKAIGELNEVKEPTNLKTKADALKNDIETKLRKAITPKEKQPIKKDKKLTRKGVNWTKALYLPSEKQDKQSGDMSKPSLQDKEAPLTFTAIKDSKTLQQKTAMIPKTGEKTSPISPLLILLAGAMVLYSFKKRVQLQETK